MWSILLMRTCFCVVSYSRCGLSGQERESVDSEKDEAGRSFGQCWDFCRWRRDRLWVRPLQTHLHTLSDAQTPPPSSWSSSAHPPARAWAAFTLKKLLPFHLTVTPSVLLGCLRTLTRCKRNHAAVQARRRTPKNGIPSHSKVLSLAVHSSVYGISVSLQLINLAVFHRYCFHDFALTVTVIMILSIIVV